MSVHELELYQLTQHHHHWLQQYTRSQRWMFQVCLKSQTCCLSQLWLSKIILGPGMHQGSMLVNLCNVWPTTLCFHTKMNWGRNAITSRIFTDTLIVKQFCKIFKFKFIALICNIYHIRITVYGVIRYLSFRK